MSLALILLFFAILASFVWYKVAEAKEQCLRSEAEERYTDYLCKLIELESRHREDMGYDQFYKLHPLGYIPSLTEEDIYNTIKRGNKLW